MKQVLPMLILLAFVPAARAEMTDLGSSFRPGTPLHLEGAPLLQWGPSTLGFSQSWVGGRSRSQGYLLKEFRSQLHPSLVLRARFGMSFQPSAMSGNEDGNARFEIPEASLTWKPGGSTVVRIQFQQGGLWGDPRFGPAGFGNDPWRRGLDPFDTTP